MEGKDGRRRMSNTVRNCAALSKLRARRNWKHFIMGMRLYWADAFPDLPVNSPRQVGSF